MIINWIKKLTEPLTPNPLWARSKTSDGTPSYAELVFLDFDGTYWPRSSEQPHLEETFSRWILENPALGIVISSNWRHVHGIEYLASILPKSIEHRVIGTLDLIDERQAGQRQRLIKQFVENYEAQFGIQVRHVALDDDAEHFEENWPYLVRCEYSKGLTESNLHKASEILSKQIR